MYFERNSGLFSEQASYVLNDIHNFELYTNILINDLHINNEVKRIPLVIKRKLETINNKRNAITNFITD